MLVLPFSLSASHSCTHLHINYNSTVPVPIVWMTLLKSHQRWILHLCLRCSAAKQKKRKTQTWKLDLFGQYLMNCLIIWPLDLVHVFFFPFASQRHQLGIAQACRLVFTQGKKKLEHSPSFVQGPAYRAHSVRVTRQCSWPFTTMQL